MRILFIHKMLFYEETLRNALSMLAEPDSIHFCHSYHEGENFIYNNVIENQSSLDLIICQEKIRGLSAIEFYRRITQNREATFSNGHFYFHTIPVVLIVDREENPRAYERDGFAAVLDGGAMDYLDLYIDELASAVRAWRRRLFDDLSNIGIHYQRGRLLYQYNVSEKKRMGIYTSTLSDEFKKKPEHFKYDWITTNPHQVEIATGKLENELKRAARVTAREERRISNLFKSNPCLVKRDNYSDFWHEKRMPLGARRSYRFDVTLKPNFNQLADISVLDLKLPKDKFIVSSGFHPTLSSRAIHHLSQMNDYKKYMENPGHESQILKAFDFVPQKVQYNILMGRMEDKERHLQTFNERLKEFHGDHVTFTTYDEFVQLQERYRTRLQILNIY